MFSTSVVITGCGVFSGSSTNAPSSKAVAFKSLKSVQIAVDRAMKTYGGLVVQGKVSAENQVNVDALHEAYRRSFRIAVMSAKNGVDGQTPDDVAKIAQEIINLISQLTK